jgi:DNA-binding LacI/PurR family transcriptional regulator
VAQNVSEIGRRAVDILLNMLGEHTSDGRALTAERFLLSADLMLRESA